MNKKRILAFLLGAILIAGIAFNAATTAKYKQDLEEVTQRINSASWSVESINQLNGRDNFIPGESIGTDKITLKNNNDYPVRFIVRLQAKTGELLNNLEQKTTDSSGNLYELDTAIGAYIFDLAAGEDKEVYSKISWKDNEVQANAVQGKSASYTYKIDAEDMILDNNQRITYLNNFTNQASLNSWNSNSSAIDNGFSFVEGSGMNIKNGVFTKFDGYKTNGITKWSNETVLDISGLKNLEGFDYSTAINSKENNHLQDFIFHIYRDGDGVIHLDADNNSTHKVPSHIVNNATVKKTSDSVLKLIQTFYPNESGKIMCNMTVKNNNNDVLFSKSIEGTDYNASQVGGYRGGEFFVMGKNEASKEESGLENGIIVKSSKVIVDESEQKLAENIEASGWGTEHIQLDFDLRKELDLAYDKASTANIIIDYYTSSGVYQKNKLWSGYLNLNDDTTKKYPGGYENNSNYKNVLPIGRYGTAVNSNSNIDVSTVYKIIVTINDGNGRETVLEVNKPN